MDDSKKILMMRKKPQCINCVYFERQPPTQEDFEIKLPQQQFFPCKEFIREELRKTQPRFDSGIFKKTGVSYNYRCRVNNWPQFNQKDLRSKSESLENVKRKRKCSFFMYYEKEFDQDPDYANRVEVIKRERNDKKITKMQRWTLMIAGLTLWVGLFPLISIYHFFKDAYNSRMKTKQDHSISQNNLPSTTPIQHYDTCYIPPKKAMNEPLTYAQKRDS